MKISVKFRILFLSKGLSPILFAGAPITPSPYFLYIFKQLSYANYSLKGTHAYFRLTVEDRQETLSWNTRHRNPEIRGDPLPLLYQDHRVRRHLLITIMSHSCLLVPKDSNSVILALLVIQIKLLPPVKGQLKSSLTQEAINNPHPSPWTLQYPRSI